MMILLNDLDLGLDLDLDLDFGFDFDFGFGFDLDFGFFFAGISTLPVKPFRRTLSVNCVLFGNSEEVQWLFFPKYCE